MAYHSEHLLNPDGTLMLYVLDDWQGFVGVAARQSGDENGFPSPVVVGIAIEVARAQLDGPYLDLGGVVMLTTKELAAFLEMSLPTVRRYAAVMAKAGILRRVGRGYVPNAALRVDLIRRGFLSEPGADAVVASRVLQ